MLFTKKELIDETGVSRNVVSDKVDELVKLEILEIDTKHAKKAYKFL